MNIWIRSQNEEVLFNVNAIQYNEVSEKHIIEGFGIDNKQSVALGVYYSKERCIEILDEIQNDICDEAYVYEMPKEEII